MNEKKTPRAAALLPIAVFLVLYLGLGIVEPCHRQALCRLRFPG